MPEVLHHTNWNMRIQRIVANRYPINPGSCYREKQDMMRLRIRRTEIIKRELVQWPVEKQDEILETMELEVGIIN